MLRMAPASTAANRSRAGSGRLGKAVFAGVRAVVLSVARTLYVLWLEVTGLLFGAFTVMAAVDLVRIYHKHAFVEDPRRWWITVGFTLICAWFTLFSFLKARRTRRGT